MFHQEKERHTLNEVRLHIDDAKYSGFIIYLAHRLCYNATKKVIMNKLVYDWANKNIRYFRPDGAMEVK